MKVIYGLDGVAYNRDINIIKKNFPNVRGWRSNWCRKYPVKTYDIQNQVEGIKEWLTHFPDGEHVEVLIDRQYDRIELATAILDWDESKIQALIIDELDRFVNALPKDFRIIGELYNGDEFGPGCGFPWDPINILKKRYNRDLTNLEYSVIVNKFHSQMPRYLKDKVWRYHAMITRSSHYYMYDNGQLLNRGGSGRNITECGIHYKFWDKPEAFIYFVKKLESNPALKRLYYHEIYPGIPGNPTARETAHDLHKFQTFMAQNKYSWEKDFSYNGAALNPNMLAMLKAYYTNHV